MNIQPELIPFDGHDFDDDCCDVCRAANQIIRKAKTEVQAMQCDSPFGKVRPEEMKLSLTINISASSTSADNSEGTVHVEAQVVVENDKLPHPAGAKITVMANLADNLTREAVKMWSTLYTCNEAVERISEMYKELENVDEHSPRASHLN